MINGSVNMMLMAAQQAAAHRAARRRHYAWATVKWLAHWTWVTIWALVMMTVFFGGLHVIINGKSAPLPIEIPQPAQPTSSAL